MLPSAHRGRRRTVPRHHPRTHHSQRPRPIRRYHILLASWPRPGVLAGLRGAAKQLDGISRRATRQSTWGLLPSPLSERPVVASVLRLQRVLPAPSGCTKPGQALDLGGVSRIQYPSVREAKGRDGPGAREVRDRISRVPSLSPSSGLQDSCACSPTRFQGSMQPRHT